MQFDPKRRELIVFFGGAAALWPLPARSHQADRLRRVGVLMAYSTDPEAQVFLSQFTRGLSELGWIEGRNLRMDIYWAPGRLDLMRTFAKEIVGLQPDVILANSTPVTGVMKRETLTIPIVFAGVSDPVGSGFVASLARPGGNITGFSHTEASLASEWPEFLRAMAPGLKRLQ
jgi:putative tryptophan/tyrosine transport system substrate-binding protein